MTYFVRYYTSPLVLKCVTWHSSRIKSHECRRPKETIVAPSYVRIPHRNLRLDHLTSKFPETLRKRNEGAVSAYEIVQLPILKGSPYVADLHLIESACVRVRIDNNSYRGAFWPAREGVIDVTGEERNRAVGLQGYRQQERQWTEAKKTAIKTVRERRVTDLASLYPAVQAVDRPRRH